MVEMPHDRQKTTATPTRVSVLFNAAHPLLATWAMALRCLERRGALAVYQPDATLRGQLDHALWECFTTDFVPHLEAGHPLAGHTPVVLWPVPPPAGTACVLSLASHVLPDAPAYHHVIDVVGSTPTERHDGRTRWRHYRQLGLDPIAFNLDHNHLPQP